MHALCKIFMENCPVLPFMSIWTCMKKEKNAILSSKDYKCNGEQKMFKLWVRTFHKTHVIKSVCIEDPSEDTRTHKIFHALEKACHELDLGQPIWLDNNVADFKRFSKVRFRQDNFFETIDFDYLEIQVIEED